MTERELISSIAQQCIEAGYDQASFRLLSPLIEAEIADAINKVLQDQQDMDGAK